MEVISWLNAVSEVDTSTLLRRDMHNCTQSIFAKINQKFKNFP